jgi:hypothetical protein
MPEHFKKIDIYIYTMQRLLYIDRNDCKRFSKVNVCNTLLKTYLEVHITYLLDLAPGGWVISEAPQVL